MTQTIDQGFKLESLQSHEIPPSGKILYGRNADGSFSPLAVNGGIVPPNSYISSGAANQDAHNFALAPTILSALAIQNTHATAMRYAKLYNKLDPTSADTPVLRYALAPAGGGITRQQLSELFSVALSVRITTGPLDNDTGAASAGDVFANLDFS